MWRVLRIMWMPNQRRAFRRAMANNGFFTRRRLALWTGILAIAGVFVTIYFGNNTIDFGRDTTVEQHVTLMQTRLQLLELQYQLKREELYNLEVNKKDTTQLTETEVPMTTKSPEIEAKLRSISGTRTWEAVNSIEKPETLHPPLSLELLPHLAAHADALHLTFELNRRRPYVDVILGVPTVKRDRGSYLMDTIEHLIRGLTKEQQNSMMIVVSVGETDMEYIVNTSLTIENKYPQEVQSGLIQVIAPNKHFYPDLKAIPPTLGDSQKRATWRTKQNLDAMFLMTYAQPKCSYYLMLEDDVIADNGYMKEILQFTAATTKSVPDWFFIQYSTTGGIGKLFRSKDLTYFITYLQLFYANMPVDWLLESYLADRVCTIDKGSKVCADAKSKIRPTYSKNLFKHIGLYSSLKGKIQKVKDMDLEKKHHGESFYPHNNPRTSKITCDLKEFKTHTAEAAYVGDTFFWAKSPKENDCVTFFFEKPTVIKSYLIRSGSYNHLQDMIYDAVLEVMIDNTFFVIDEFDEFGMAEGEVPAKIGPIKAIRIRFTDDSKFWVIMTEIEFHTEADLI